MNHTKHEKVYQQLTKHVSAESLARVMTELASAPDRLLNWILQQDKESAIVARRVSLVVPWLVRSFNAIDEIGTESVTETEFLQKTNALCHTAKGITIDRAFRKLWQDYSGTILNSLLSGINGGNILIRRDNHGKERFPFDFVLLNDDDDDLRVNLIVLGYPDDTQEQIRTRIEARFSYTTPYYDPRLNIFGPLLPLLADRLSVKWFFIGGSEDRAETTIVSNERSWTVISLKNFCEDLELRSTDFADYLKYGDSTDRYTSEAGALCDTFLNNARFSLQRRSLSLEEWAFVQPLLVRHHELVKQNPEILTAIQLVSPLEVGIKTAEILESPEWLDSDRHYTEVF